MESWSNGPHLLEFEPPDMFHCHVRAPIQAVELVKTTRIIQAELEEKRGIRVYFIAYMESPDATFTPGARRMMGNSKVNWKAVIIVGGNAVLRTATNVMVRSVNLLQGNTMPFKMVKTPEEARAYVAELRAQEAAEARAKKR